MRTTIKLSPALHERVRRQAMRQDISMACLLGQLVERGLGALTAVAVPKYTRSGRFHVIAPADADARVTSDQVRRLVERVGIL